MVIFVVDDVGTNLTVTKAVLEDLYDVVTVSSGKKALALIEKITPDLILLDIDMPEMSGLELLNHLKADARYQYIPVIFLSGMIDNETKSQALNLGAVDFITKPFSPPELLEKVSRWL